jgi:hypothetical protein
VSAEGLVGAFRCELIHLAAVIRRNRGQAQRRPLLRWRARPLAFGFSFLQRSELGQGRGLLCSEAGEDAE